MSTHATGARYEAAAARTLERRGFTVLARNVRFGRKEIDLVVRRGPVVAFVEVKGRRSGRYGHPLDAITPRKRREVERVARWWMTREGRPGTIYRFDAVAVFEEPGGRLVVEHVEDAWRPSRRSGWAPGPDGRAGR